jgi:predicted amidohydrolase YtcJ
MVLPGLHDAHVHLAVFLFDAEPTSLGDIEFFDWQ